MKMQQKIIQQFTDTIFPFHYDIDSVRISEASYKNAKGKNIFLFEQFSQESHQLRGGLAELMEIEGGSAKIANCYRMTYNARAYFGLPRRADTPLEFSIHTKADGKKCPVYISDIKVYLFESGVGLLDLEYTYLSDLVEDYIDCNYFLCERKAERSSFSFTAKENADGDLTAVTRTFNLQELLEKIYAEIGAVVDIKGGTPQNSEGKGIVFSYLLLNDKPDDLDDLLFHLRKNYKDSYLFPPTEGKNPYVLHQFENSYWTTSYNGAVNLSFLSGEADTDAFFCNAFSSKLKSTYLTLFLHILHQRFALMKSIGEMGKLDRFSMDYAVMKEQLKAANACRADAVNLKFRAFFLLPSEVEHVNDYYALLYRTYKIQMLYESFSRDLNSVRETCEMYVMRIKAREEKFKARRKARIGVFVSILGTVVAVFSILDSSWSIFEKIFGEALSFWSVQVLAVIFALLAPVVTIIVDVVGQIREIRKMSSDLRGEVEDHLVEDDKLRKSRLKSRKKEKQATSRKNHFPPLSN